MAWFAWKRYIDQNLSGEKMMPRKNAAKEPEYIPYIGDTFAVLIGGRLHVVGDLLNYGPPTHAFYRYGRIWYLRVIEPLTDEELYFALEFTLAHDLPTLHITELR